MESLGQFPSQVPGSVQLGGQPKCTETLHCPFRGKYLCYLFNIIEVVIISLCLNLVIIFVQ